ncbi:hypothetical protein SEPCBS57363_000901 [Sporothrix epigloea]|uniref:Guanyl-nucleotide exchange factor n=1 Tax=Sporothrix epigloea TaxID=1892477 RepID=A0ABP0D8D7_9PEZI
MPFLRRRGGMASESDMRRHTSIFSPLTTPKLAQRSETPPSLGQSQASTQSSNAPALLAEPFAIADADSSDIDLGEAVSAAGTAAAIAATESATPTAPSNTVSPQSPVTPSLMRRPKNGGDATRGTVSIDNEYLVRPDSPPVQEQTLKHRRFSLLRFRNASDSQLAARARQQAQEADTGLAPPVPNPPEIVMTAPTSELDALPQKRQKRVKLPGLTRKSSDLPRDTDVEEPTGRISNAFGSWSRREGRKSMIAPFSSNGKQPAIAFDDTSLSQRQQQEQLSLNPTSGYRDETSTTLALPVNRLSESSRSDGSSGDRAYGSTLATDVVQTTSSFFRLPRRRKNSSPPSLFPISHLPQKGQPTIAVGGAISQDSTGSAFYTNSPPPPRTPSRGGGAFGRGLLGSIGAVEQETPTQSRPVSQRYGTATPPKGLAPSPAMALFQKGNPSPVSAFFRPSSRNSGRSSPTRSIPGGLGPLGRGRSSTFSSVGKDSITGRDSVEDHLSRPALRSSLSATGRKSISDLLGLSRLRQNSEPNRQGALTPATPCSSTSKNNSLQLARDSFVLPDRREDDTPARYLARLEEIASRSVIGSALSKFNDVFFQSVLRSYMRSFKFFTEPMDMAIRKLLMDAELPRETQHIDRFLQAFANRYHECNPGIFSSPDQAYFIAFSLLILHTDVFNKNNKYKMQKSDYQKNTRGEGIFDEILDVFYDNISYTPFIHVEDDIDINGERIVTHKTKRKTIFSNNVPDVARKSSKEPIDPYTLIIDDKLEILRPNLKEIMQIDDPYSYLGTATALNMKELQATFFRTGVLQLLSARSRPDAFMTEKTASNPEESHPGIVDMKVTKVGLLWRKEEKKKKTRSPWQEWGAILTGAQLFFFRNTSWVKGLIHQYETHIKHGHEEIPIIFKPPVIDFRPDNIMTTNGAVALLDSSYKKHKHAFTYVRKNGDEEVLLADNEDDMNDWLAKLNYAAAFQTSDVQIRGVLGGSYNGQDRRAIRRLGSDDGHSVQTPSGEVMITRSRIDHKMAHEILAARRETMLQKIKNANQKLGEEGKRLEVQLRNARHLQIMAPIQPKTRDQMLISAERIASQLKVTRMSMWRVRCHRDILLLDLDDERQLSPNLDHTLETGAAFAGIVGVSPATSGLVAPNEGSMSSLDNLSQSQLSQLQREQSKTSTASTIIPLSPQSAVHRGSVASGSIGSGGAGSNGQAAPGSPLSDVFRTSPSNVNGAGLFQLPHPSPSDAGAADLDFASLRKSSVSSAISSGPSITTSPSRAMHSSNSAQENTPQSQHTATSVAVRKVDASQRSDGDNSAPDADEHSLQQKNGLLEAVATNVSGSVSGAGKNKLAGLGENGSGGVDSKQQVATDVSQTPQHDKNKIRRSLHRTLREGAGHLSTRGRKTKDASGAGANEDVAEEPITLERGSGSFVVHGKKASVITFGSDFPSILPPDERLRQKKQQQQQQQQQQQDHHLPTVPDAPPEMAASGQQATAQDDDTDYRASIFQDRDRRESAASASTATARSFRELHQKYSTVRTASRSSAGGKSPASDDEGEVAESSSEDRHTPQSLGVEESKRKKYLSGVGEVSSGEEGKQSGDASTADDGADSIPDDERDNGEAVGFPYSSGDQPQLHTPQSSAPSAAPVQELPENADVYALEERSPSHEHRAVKV